MTGYARRIGVSPAGVVWVAYRPKDVERMHAALTRLWKQHEAKRKTK